MAGTKMWGGVAAAAVMLGVLATPIPPASGAVRPAASPPAVSDFGRFHVVTPARLVDSSTGTGISPGPLSAHGTATTKVTGAAGVPKSGVAAVVVTLAGVEASGSTQLWIGPAGVPKPSLPSVVVAGAGASRSAFAVVPVPATGKVTVWNGAAATGVTVDVSGWVSSASEPGTAGLFDALAPRSVLDTSSSPLAAGERRDVTVAGVAGIPTTGVGAVLLRVATSATAAGAVSVVPAAPSLPAVTTMLASAGADQDLAFVALGDVGQVSVVNQGTAALGLQLSVVGFVTDGSDANAIGDTFTATAPGTVLSAAVGIAGSDVQLAGVDGIPAAADPTPATAVLLRISVTAPTADGALALNPSGGAPGGAALLLRKHAGTAAAALVAPGPTGAVTASTSVGSAGIAVEPLAYLSGSVSVQPNAKPLDAGTLGVITSVTPDTVSFAGVPPALASVAVGDVVAGGISATTPQGLLRTVTAVDTTGGNLTLSTTQAALSDAIAQGRLSAGVTDDGAAASSPSRAAVRRTAASEGDGCEENGDIFSGSLGATCTVSDDAGPVSVSVNAQANLGFAFDASIHWGFPPSLELSASATASASVSGNVTAHLGGAIDDTVSLPGWKGEPIEFSIGPVPVVIVPEVDPSLEVQGSLSADQSVTGTVSAGATLAYSTKSGASLTPTFDASGNATLGADAVAGDVRLSFVPEVKADFYDSGAGIGAAVVPYVDAAIDPCNVTGTAGVQLQVSLSAGKLVPDVSDVDWSWTPADTQIFAFPWHSCAYWTGTIAFSQKSTTTDASSALDTDRDTESVTMTLEDLGRPDPQGILASGSGSGSLLQGRPDEQCFGAQDNFDIKWSGAVTQATGSPLVVRVDSVGSRQYELQPWEDGGDYFGFAPATDTDHVWNEGSHGGCHATNTTSYAPYGDVLLQAPAPLTFRLAKGATHVKKRIPLHLTQTVASDTTVTSSVLVYDLTVKCSLGATSCGLP